MFDAWVSHNDSNGFWKLDPGRVYVYQSDLPAYIVVEQFQGYVKKNIGRSPKDKHCKLSTKLLLRS